MLRLSLQTDRIYHRALIWRHRFPIKVRILMLRPEKLPSNNLRSDFAASWSKLVCKKTVTITEEEIRTVFERFGGTSQIVLVDENFFCGGGGGWRVEGGGCVALISFGLKCHPLSLAWIPYNVEAARLKLYTVLLFHKNLEIKLLSSFHYFFSFRKRAFLVSRCS